MGDLGNSADLRYILHGKVSRKVKELSCPSVNNFFIYISKSSIVVRMDKIQCRQAFRIIEFEDQVNMHQKFPLLKNGGLVTLILN